MAFALPLALGLGAGASILGSWSQERSANRAINTQREQFERTQKLQEPFRQAGLTANNRILELLGIGGNSAAQGYGQYGRDFNESDFQQDPGYSFRLKEGLKALDHLRGGRVSGNAIRAGVQYGQELGSQEYQNAFNRYQTGRNNQLNPLFSLSGQGQNATNALTQYGQNYGNSVGELQQGAGNARAAGYVGGANAVNSGLSSYLNYNQNQQLLNSLMPKYGVSSLPGE